MTTMASLTFPGGSMNLNPLVHASEVKAKGRRAVKCGSHRCSSAARCLVGRVVSMPVRCRNFSLIQSDGVFSRSSSSCSSIRCNAESRPDVNQQEQQPGSSNFDTESIEERGAVAVVAEANDKQELQRPTDEKVGRWKNFWATFKEQHEVYRLDREQWGLGFTPIFTIHQDDEGNRDRVDVNEDEIRLRSGVDPNKMDYADEECIAVADQRIKLANDHARDIQLGLTSPHPLSVVYEYKREGSATTSTVGNGSRSGQPWSSSEDPWQFLILLIPLLSVALLGMGVKRLFSKKEQKEDPAVHEENLQKMRMKKLKAEARRESLNRTSDLNPPAPQLGGESNDVINRAGSPGEDELQNSEEVSEEIIDTGLASVKDEEFQKKVAEIQAMARHARLQEQESAEARSAQSFERKKLLEEERKARRRAQRLEKLEKDHDDGRILRVDHSDGPDATPASVTVLEEKNDIGEVGQNGHASTSQVIRAGSDNDPVKQPGPDSPLAPKTLPLGFKPNSPNSTGVKPRIILSAEEARARIAGKRARLNASSATSSSSEPDLKRKSARVDQSTSEVGPSNMGTPSSTNFSELRSSVSSSESPVAMSDGVLGTAEHSGNGGGSSDSPQKINGVPTEETSKHVTVANEPSSNSEDINHDQQETAREIKTEHTGRERGQGKSKDEEEEMAWMRDEVLRDIVFKVHANEEAGREPFYNLNSEQETLFFKGLERKFEREGDEVKKWIKDRVENIDYGSNGISIYDPPESYEMKWKEGVDRSPKADFRDRFNRDRDRMISERKGLDFTSPPVSEAPAPADSSSPPSPSPAPSTSAASSIQPPLPDLSSDTSSPAAKGADATQERSAQNLSADIEKKVVISSSPRAGNTVGSHPSTSQRPETGNESKGNWDHTKRWSKELERKYALETDPATKALMRDVGKDLERWITEDEIEAASRMLDKGAEGEEEYARMHYERTKEKIKKQRETFGRDAMLNKYSEYKVETEEVELWWLDLPFVVCVGLQATVEGELRTGFYSVDVSAALDGIPGLPSVPYHTVAFQDRGDARNFCTLINSQPEKVGADGAEPVALSPKELYKDAKAEGFKVTVIKKGQLQLSVDNPFEEVESRIIELGSARYYDELVRDRVIDMGSVVDDGLGFGQRSQ